MGVRIETQCPYCDHFQLIELNTDYEGKYEGVKDEVIYPETYGYINCTRCKKPMFVEASWEFTLKSMRVTPMVPSWEGKA